MNKIYAVARGGKNEKSLESADFGNFILETLQNSGKKTKDIYLHQNGMFTIDGFPVVLSEKIKDFYLIWIAFLGGSEDLNYITSLCEEFSVLYVGHSPVHLEITKNKSNFKKVASQHGIKSPYFYESLINSKDKIYEEALKIYGLVGIPVNLKNNNHNTNSEDLTSNSILEIENHLHKLHKNTKNILAQKVLSGDIFKVFLHSKKNTLHSYIFLEKEFNGKKSQKSKQEILEEIKLLASKLYHFACFKHHIEFDFLVNDSGIYFLDINTNPFLNQEKYKNAFLSSGETLEEYILETVSL